MGEPAPRTVALVGPYLSGKTTLLENILFATQSIGRKGSTREHNTVGDGSGEAREREMGVEVNVASMTYLGDRFHILDCPGSIEFAQETLNAVIGADLAVVVCEPDADRARTLAPLLKYLDEKKIPCLFFINKIDKIEGEVAAVVEALQQTTARRLVLRQVPVRTGEGITGYVDLASGRAYAYQADAASQQIEPPAAMAEEIKAARFAMLEAMADFDDELMEKLLEDVDPQSGEVFKDIKAQVADARIAPVMIGAAEHEHGLRRLLKAFRHDTPPPAVATRRVGLDPDATATVCQALKTFNFPNMGKLTLVRVWQGALAEGVQLNGIRPSGLFDLMGQQSKKRGAAAMGDIVALGRMEDVRTGATLSTAKEAPALPRPPLLEPVYTLAIAAANRNDEVKLSGALAKLTDEDPSYVVEHTTDTHQLLLHGQGEIHLRVAVARLKLKSGIEVATSPPQVPYKEAIQKPTTVHGRHKRQSGGHGQFGDVHLRIAPLPRGSGFQFNDEVVGGVVPRQFIPAVEAGVCEYLDKGPLGHPVVDVAVTLFDGSYHAVDSSEMAFKTAGRIAMAEGMPKCSPVLLEPILHVTVYVPADCTAKVTTLVSGRRGQILGFEAREGWTGWDVVNAHIPQSEIHDLIVELRSLTLGVGTYTARFDRLQELTGRLADQVRAQAAAE